jgi:DHA1 family chloramphenicol resistance protein-like MFS transporter
MPRPAPRALPLALYLLGLAVFAQATSEFMLSGLVPDIARDLKVSLLAAGLLTSAFAVGMVVGAPLMAVLSTRLPRRPTLVAFLAAFLLVHVLGALTSSYAVLLGTRVVAALANAGFLAVALAAATAMVAPDMKGRATAVLLGGTTIACVAGVPAGALLGQVSGWRAAFWAVAIVSVPALVAIVRSVPADATSAAGTRVLRGERQSLRSSRLAVTLLLGALVNAGTFSAFTYLALLVTDVAELPVGWVPVALALFGLGSFVGVTIGGRAADARPGPFLQAATPALLVGWVLFAVVAGHPVALVALSFVQGTLSFAVGSVLIARVFYTAPGASTLAGGSATAAFNVGAAIGPWLGGTAIDAGLGHRAPLWVAALLVGLALAVAGGARIARQRRSTHAQPQRP